MRKKYRIRKARAEDAKTISKLAIRSKAHWGYTKEFMEACIDELSVPSSKLQRDDSIYYVAENESLIIGYYGMKNLLQGQYELNALFVEPDFMGMGIGRDLLQHSLNIARNLGGHILLIQSDPNAEKFYLAEGANLIGHQESESIPGRSLPLLSMNIKARD